MEIASLKLFVITIAKKTEKPVPDYSTTLSSSQCRQSMLQKPAQLRSFSQCYHGCLSNPPSPFRFLTLAFALTRDNLYESKDGRTTVPYESSYTTAWGGSISSTNKCCLSGQKAPRTRTWSPFEVTPSNSKSLFVGVHYDLVTDEDLHATDRTLQRKIKCSSLLDDKVVYHNSPDNSQID